MASLTKIERALAILLPRAILGLVYFFAGIHKIVDFGPAAYGQAMAMTDGARFVPAALLTAVGFAVPFLEVGLGALLLLGFRVRVVLRLLAALLVLITLGYGISGLLNPVGATAMNIAVVNTFILPRAALLILLLTLPAEDDLLSADSASVLLRTGLK
jgi:uncharacterized membrane protein YphA (DoxX/SURF4 family)